MAASGTDHPRHFGSGGRLRLLLLPSVAMNALPNIHDHSLLEYRVDLANRRITLITLPAASRTQPKVRPVQTVFEGREAHHLGGRVL